MFGTIVRRAALLAAPLLLPLGSVVLLAPQAHAAVDTPVRVNANGDSYTGSGGTTWSADQAYNAGSWGHTTSYGSGSADRAVADTDDDELYQNYRLFDGGAGYRFDVPDGAYEVTVQLMEPWATGPGQRVFDVRAEGEVALSGVDIYASCGSYTACDRSFTTSVTDGQLDIGFATSGGASYATVSAIAVTGSGDGDEPDTEAPSAPGDLRATGTTDSSASLAWDASSDNVGVSGYRVVQDGEQVAMTPETAQAVTGLSPDTSYTFTVEAYDEAGNTSPASKGVTATTESEGDDGDGGDGLPDHALTGYWQNFVNGAEPLEVSDVPSGYDVLAVAFGVGGDEPGEVSFGVDQELSDALGGYSKSDLVDDIAAKQAAGKTVILSVGGAAAQISVRSAQAATNFADSVYALMQEYGFDGVDIDLERGFDPDHMADALHQLADMAGPDLVLTMAPQTLYVQPGGRYLDLITQTADIITVVHTQYYNSGSMNGCDGGIYATGDVDFMTALSCILLRGPLDGDQVAFGHPAQPQAAGSGYVNPSLITQAVDCMVAGTQCGDFQPDRTYPNLRGVMTWSINWDASNGYNFMNTIAPYLDSLS